MDVNSQKIQLEELNPWKKLKQEKVYESPWISVEHHDVLNPAGNPGTYSVVRFKNLAIGIIPLDDDDNTYMVGQYRFPFDEYSWEIPEGGGDREVNPLESAKRELLEECGIIANDWQLIQQMQTSNAATDEYCYIFVAKDLTFTNSQPEENEQLLVRKIPFEQLYDLVNSGAITDSLSVAGVLRAKLLQMEGKL